MKHFDLGKHVTDTRNAVFVGAAALETVRKAFADAPEVFVDCMGIHFIHDAKLPPDEIVILDSHIADRLRLAHNKTLMWC
ncbi:MAG: hypothetical protein WC114_08815 [Smithellaceae bacterium]|jgi:hypothetical protein